MIPIDELFECPKCHCRRLEEVQANIILSTPIVEIGPDNEILYDCDLQTAEGDDDTFAGRYQCVECGLILPRCASPSELYAFLTDPNSTCKPKGPPDGSTD